MIKGNDYSLKSEDDMKTSLNILSLNYFGKMKKRYGSPIVDPNTKRLSKTFLNILKTKIIDHLF